MKPLIIKVLAKQKIVLSRASISFLRGVSTTKSLNIGYSNGTGQSLSAGTVLYTTGTPNTIGYLNVVVSTTAALQGAGLFNVSVTHYPSTSQANQNIDYVIDGSTGTIAITYSSAPVTDDILVETPNRTTYYFTVQDFTDSITDPDGVGIDSVAIFVAVQGIMLNNVQYVAGTWIPLADIAQSRLSYIPQDVDNEYLQNAQYKARDVNGVESLE